MQWSFLWGEHEHRNSGPICVRYLLSRRSLKVKHKGPAWPTKNRVILEATSSSCITWTGILERYGWDRDIFTYYYSKNISFTGKAQIMKRMIERNRMLFILYLLRNMLELKSEKMTLTTKLILFGSLLGIAGGIGLYLYRKRRISTPTSPLKPHLIPNI
jgi:hypothetical protein